MRETKVREIMATEIVTLSAGDTLRLADDLMAMADLRHFPVLRQGKVVGVVSQLALVRTSLNLLIERGKGSPREVLGSMSIESMKMEVPTVISPDTPVKEAARLMVEKRADCLVIVEKGVLVGLATRTDLLREMAKR
jgi:acetoin utilization protein AcuB